MSFARGAFGLKILQTSHIVIPDCEIRTEISLSKCMDIGFNICKL
jgi:hypothetical protein